MEYALIYSAVIIPITFGIIFVAQMFWVWHTVADFTRRGAQYAATHCWQTGGANVLEYMRTNVPPMVDRDQFQQGEAQIAVEYFTRDAATGALTEYSCDLGDCSSGCIPDFVTVRVTSYQFARFFGYLGLAPVTIPEFRATTAIGNAGCSEATLTGEESTCTP